MFITQYKLIHSKFTYSKLMRKVTILQKRQGHNCVNVFADWFVCCADIISIRNQK